MDVKKYRILVKSNFDKKVRRYSMSCKCQGSCHEKGKKSKKTEANNQWCGASAVGHADDHQMKTSLVTNGLQRTKWKPSIKKQKNLIKHWPLTGPFFIK